MKPLYITAVVTFSGKTALLLGIGLKLQSMGHKIGYYKPVSTQPYRTEAGVVDEDADFVRRTLGLQSEAKDLSTVIIDDNFFAGLMAGKDQHDFVNEVKDAYKKASDGKDVLLVEGGASMREGYAVGLNITKIAEMFDLPTLGVVRFRDGLKLIDDILALKVRLGDRLLGVVINSVPAEAMTMVKEQVWDYLERTGIKVYGVLPQNPSLMALTVGELTSVLNAKTLNKSANPDALIENLSVGAMSVEAAMPHFRRTLRKAVITGGDRADIQAAALETSTTALVLTGNLQPTSTIVKRAEEQGVAVLMVPSSTIDTVEAIEQVFGKTRLAHPEKLNRFRDMLDQNLDWTRLFKDMGVS
jgi:uncharacterized protein